MKQWENIEKIITKRLLLRHINYDDIYDLYEYNKDEQNTYWIEIEPYKSLDDARNAIKDFFLNPNTGKYGIILKEINKLIGVIDIRKQTNYSIGYILNKNFENNGYMHEAVYALLDIALNKLNIEFVEIHIAKQNLKSNNLALKFNKNIYSTYIKFNKKHNLELEYNIYRIYKGDLSG